MVLPPILGEALLTLLRGSEALGAGVSAGVMAAGFVAAFVVGCLACRFMLEIVRRGKLIWFAVYCAIAGAVAIIGYIC